MEFLIFSYLIANLKFIKNNELETPMFFFTFSSEKVLDLCKMGPPPFLSNVHVLRPSEPEKSARFARTFSSRPSLARMNAPRARDLMIVALRAPTYMNFALRAQCCVLHSAEHSGVNCLLLAEQYQNFYF